MTETSEHASASPSEDQSTAGSVPAPAPSPAPAMETRRIPAPETVKARLLKVHTSNLRIAGRVRVHCDLLSELLQQERFAEIDEAEIEEKGKLLVVVHGEHRLLLRAYCDRLIERAQIGLRLPDMEALEAYEGDTVEVYLHKSLVEAFLEGVSDIVEHWGAWLERKLDIKP